MKSLRLLAILTLPCPALFGDPTPEAIAFLKVPEAVWSYKNEAQAFGANDLPDDLRKVVSTTLNAGDPAPAEYAGYSLDLNNDRSPEFFLRSKFGGSGGPHYFIFSQRDGQWNTIGDFQGGFHLLKPVNGWNPIIGYTRGGGDSYAMFRLDFRGGQYDEIWIAHFDAGQIIPPEGLIPHRAWCDDARSPEELIQRLEGFWKEFLPQCDGGTNPERDEYEDAPHISYIRGTAYELALAYTSAGRQDDARRLVKWLRWTDQLELWSDQPNPLSNPPGPHSENHHEPQGTPEASPVEEE